MYLYKSVFIYIYIYMYGYSCMYVYKYLHTYKYGARYMSRIILLIIRYYIYACGGAFIYIYI